MANNYRNADFTPYAFYTTDFGKTWERIIDEEYIFGYALCILQDPIEPQLVYLGTEHGLWVSIDEGENWVRWTHGVPAVSTMDLALQEREADLVIGTFGRSIYILDDIRPLREIAASGGESINNQLTLFDPSDAIIVNGTQANSGSHFPADGIFIGESKPTGAQLKIFVKMPKGAKRQRPNRNEMRARMASRRTSGNMPAGMRGGPGGRGSRTDSLKITIYNSENKLIKTINQNPDPGLNIISWRLDEGEMKMPTRGSDRGGRGGRFGSRGNKTVLPGKYKVIAEYKGVKDSVELNVVMDPRIPVPTDALIAQREMIDDLTSKIEVLYKGTQQLIESKGITDKVSAQIDGVKGDETKELQNSVKAVKDSINAVQDNIFGKQNAETQGITSRENNSVTGRIQSALRYINSRPGKPTLTEEKLVKEATELISKAVENINRFYVNVWPEFREKVENTEIPLFKDYDLLELNE